MPIDLTVNSDVDQKIPESNSNEEDPDQKLRQLSEKISNKHSLDLKRKPPCIIECNMDPTVRKKSRDLHPMNRIKTKTMKKSSMNISVKETAPRTPETSPSITTTADIDCLITNVKPIENDKSVKDYTKIVNDDLSISDSESELEEGELKTKNNNTNSEKAMSNDQSQNKIDSEIPQTQILTANMMYNTDHFISNM